MPCLRVYAYSVLVALCAAATAVIILRLLCAHDGHFLQISSNNLLTSVSFPALGGVGDNFQVSILASRVPCLRACVLLLLRRFGDGGSKVLTVRIGFRSATATC